MGVEAGPGTRWRRRIRRRRWSEPEEGNGDVAAMQGFRGAVERWGGRGSRGGAPELVGEARGGRRRWLWRTAATVVFGRAGERERGRAGESEWGVGEVGATTRRRSTRRNGDQGDAERLGGAWRARARHAHLPACSGEGKQLAGTGQHSAGPAGLGRTGKSSPFFIFCFLFLFNISATLLN